MASTDQINKRAPKHPMSQTDIDRKISESAAGETGDDIRSDKYKQKDIEGRKGN